MIDTKYKMSRQRLFNIHPSHINNGKNVVQLCNRDKAS